MILGCITRKVVAATGEVARRSTLSATSGFEVTVGNRDVGEMVDFLGLVGSWVLRWWRGWRAEVGVLRHVPRNRTVGSAFA